MRWLDGWGLDCKYFYRGLCSVCDLPVADHPSHGGTSAKWPHRRAALKEILFDGWI